MGNFLNVVYDNWREDLTPKPNLENIFGENKFKVVNGLFGYYEMMFKVRMWNVEDVYNNPNENFYYFINPIGNSMYLFEEYDDIPLPQDVKECLLKCENFNIVFINEHEFEEFNYLKFIHDKSIINNFDQTRIYVLNNNSKLDLYKEELGTKINVYSLRFLLNFISGHMIEYKHEFEPNKTGKFFLCHNRSAKPHRYSILVLLKNSGLLENVDWSLLMGWNRMNNRKNGDISKNFFGPYFNLNEFNKYKEEIDYFENISIKRSDYEENKGWFDEGDPKPDFNWKDIYEMKSYKESYVNIVTESNFALDPVHITEKSIKPFYFHQLPIFLASYEHVKYFKQNYDFDFFDDIIDHSYDNIKDNKERLLKVFSEIKRLWDNREELKKFYILNQHRFELNKIKVEGVKKTKYDMIYFTTLINKTHK
jgi:hypothetical protein